MTDHIPKVTVLEPYLLMQYELAVIVGEALLEIDDFQRQAEELAERFPWLRDEFYPWRQMLTFEKTESFNHPQWPPPDWREAVGEMREIASYWGLSDWKDGVVVVAKAVQVVIHGLDGFVFGGIWTSDLLPNTIRFEVEVKYIIWGWRDLWGAVKEKVEKELRRRYIPKSFGGAHRRRNPMTLMRDVRLYLWRQQGLSYDQIIAKWGPWFRARLKDDAEAWKKYKDHPSARKKTPGQLRDEWLKLESLKKSQIKYGIHRVKKLLRKTES